MSTLQEIEQSLTTLWLNHKSRVDFLNGQNKELDAELARQIDKEGVELYAGLLSIGHHDVINSIYPFCARLLKHKWDSVVDDYLNKFPPNHYHFNKTGQRLPLYFAEQNQQILKKYPFIAELADYEWIEMELLEADVKIDSLPFADLAAPDQFARHKLVINPTLVQRHYTYPIPDIVENLKNSGHVSKKVAQDPTIVAILRHPETHKCRFLNLAPLASTLVEQARTSQVPVSELISNAVKACPDQNPQETVLDCLNLIESLTESGAIVGIVAVS